MPIVDKKTESFSEAYSNYYPLIYNSVYKRVNNASDVKDVCQEIFFRLYERYERVENVRRWLFGAMNLVLKEYYRKNSRKSREKNIDDVYDDAGVTFINGFRDTRIMIEEALNDMDNFIDEKERILFELIAIQNSTYKMAGDYVGLSARQVRYKYGLIVARLIKYFNKKGIKSIEELL